MPKNVLNVSSDASSSLAFCTAHLSHSISRIDSNPCNLMHLLNTLKGKAFSKSMLTLPSSANVHSFNGSSINFFIHFHSTCFFVLAVLQSGSSFPEHHLAKSALQLLLLVDLLESDLTLLYRLASCVWCLSDSLRPQSVNSQQILYRNLLSYQCLLHDYSQYYLVLRISPLMRGQISYIDFTIWCHVSIFLTLIVNCLQQQIFSNSLFEYIVSIDVRSSH